MSERKCFNCDAPVTHRLRDVCDRCWRDPKTNDCEKCGRHLDGIDYPYTCGACIKNVSVSPHSSTD